MGYIMDFEVSTSCHLILGENSTGSISISHLLQSRFFFFFFLFWFLIFFFFCLFCFMSVAPDDAMRCGERYVLSPVDNIELFRWVLLYMLSFIILRPFLKENRT